MSERARRVVAWSAGVLLGLYVLSCVLVAVLYRRYLYMPQPPHEFPAGTEPEVLRRKAGDGVDTVTLLCRGNLASERDPLVVYFHANAEAAGDSRWFSQPCLSSTRAWAAIEYRGYGLSGNAGPTTEAGIYADADAGLAALRDAGFGEERTILVGFSLGTGVAVEMARRGHGHGLVLLAPFTSIPRVVDRWAFALPTRLLIGDRFDSLSKAGAIHVPTLIVHGDADELVPYAMGVELSKAIAGAKLVTVKGAGHNDLFSVDVGPTTSAIEALIATARAPR